MEEALKIFIDAASQDVHNARRAAFEEAARICESEAERLELTRLLDGDGFTRAQAAETFRYCAATIRRKVREGGRE